MAAALPITLRALADAAAGSETGTAVDCTLLTASTDPSSTTRVPRWAAKLGLDVISLSAGAVLQVEIETSDDEVAWRTLYSRSFQAAPTERLELHIGGLQRYLRAKSTLSGSGTPAARFGLLGEAHTVYCTPRQLVSDAVPEAAIANTVPPNRVRACIVASTEVEGYLASAYSTPILAWGDDLAEKTALIAVAKLFNVRGRVQESPDSGVFEAAREAVTWCNRVANGQLKPPGIVDTTPEVFEGGSVVLSRPSRGW